MSFTPSHLSIYSPYARCAPWISDSYVTYRALYTFSCSCILLVLSPGPGSLPSTQTMLICGLRSSRALSSFSIASLYFCTCRVRSCMFTLAPCLLSSTMMCIPADVL